MTQQSTAAETESEGNPTAHFVHAVARFALAVRHRKSVVVVALIIAALLGGLYYLTATRYYGAKAELMILDVGSDPIDYTATPRDSWQQTLLPNFRTLIASEKVVRKALEGLRPEDRVDFQDKPRDEWVEAAQRNLSVKNERKTTILDVRYCSRDPHAAVAIVNAVVDAYLDCMDKTYKSTAEDIKDVLTKKEREIVLRLDRAIALRDQARRDAHDLRTGDDGQTLHPLVERAVAANKQLTETVKHRQELEAALGWIQEAVARGEVSERHIAALEGVLETDPQALLGLNYTGELMANLQQSVIEDRAELQTLRRFYLSAHPEIVALENKVRVTEQSLLEYPALVKQELVARLGPELVGMVQERLNQVRRLEASLRSEFGEAEEAALEIGERLDQVQNAKREIEYLYSMRDAIANQIENANLRHEGQQLRAQVIEEPEVDEKPVSPSLAKTGLMVLLLGFGSGLAAVYVLDTLSDRFRSPEEMQALLGVRVLAMVPELPRQSAESRTRAVDRTGRGNEERGGDYKTVEGVAGIEALQVYAAPNAAESEAFRTLRTALSFAEEDTHQLVVSSPEPSDGKTTVLANLGVAVAQSGKRVLLIDADLRRPGLTALLGMRGVEGLSSVIRGEDDVVRMAQAHVRASELDGLDVLPAGPRPANPAELLGSQRFSELLAWAEASYDQILIDSPPTLATSDSAVIGRLAGGAVLVVHPSKNRRRAVMRSVESFALMKIPLVGLVVNRIGSTKDGYYGYEGYYGYRYPYGGGMDQADEIVDGRSGEEGLAAEGAAASPQDDTLPAERIVPRRVA